MDTVVLAIGGNALAPAGLGHFAEQEERARGVAQVAVGIVASGRRPTTVCITASVFFSASECHTPIIP